MRKVYTLLLISVFISVNLFAQNIGQKGDTLTNYTDINGLKQGYWTKNYPSGKIAYETTFKNDNPVGELKRYFKNGKIEVLLTYDDKGEFATAAVYYENGKLAAEGFYFGQEKDSTWKYYSPLKKLLFQENYKKGERHGKHTKWFEDGTLCEEMGWKDGKRDGVWRQYFPNGEVKFETLHKENVRTGLFILYYSSGRVESQGRYKDDLKDDKWLYFDEKGELKFEIIYQNGVPLNSDELEEAQQEEFRKIEENKGKIQEPSDEDMFRSGGY